MMQVQKGNKYSDIVKGIAEKEGANFMILSVQIESEFLSWKLKKRKQNF